MTAISDAFKFCRRHVRGRSMPGDLDVDRFLNRTLEDQVAVLEFYLDPAQCRNSYNMLTGENREERFRLAEAIWVEIGQDSPRVVERKAREALEARENARSAAVRAMAELHFEAIREDEGRTLLRVREESRKRAAENYGRRDDE